VWEGGGGVYIKTGCRYLKRLLNWKIKNTIEMDNISHKKEKVYVTVRKKMK
jgi:hypothetical protein